MSKNVLESYMKTKFFRLLILILTILSMTEIFETKFRYPFLKMFSYNVILEIYVIMCLLIVLLVNNIYLYKKVFNTYPVLARYSSKNKYYEFVDKTVFKSTFLLFGYYIVLSLFIASFANFFNFIIEIYEPYNIPMIIYLIFHICRLYVVFYFLSKVILFVLNKNNSLYIIIYVSSIFYFSLFTVTDITEVTSITQLRLNISYYIFGFTCANFLQEVVFSLLYIIIFVGIVKIFEKISRRKIYDV